MREIGQGRIGQAMTYALAGMLLSIPLAVQGAGSASAAELEGFRGGRGEVTKVYDDEHSRWRSHRRHGSEQDWHGRWSSHRRWGSDYEHNRWRSHNRYGSERYETDHDRWRSHHRRGSDVFDHNRWRSHNRFGSGQGD